MKVHSFWRTFFVLIPLCFVGIAQAQVSVAVGPSPKIQFFNQTGQPAAGYIVCSFLAGTNTPSATYTDSSGTTQNSNPIVLDSAGRANIWYAGHTYKLLLAGGGTCGSPSNLQWTVDNFSVGVFSSADNIFSGNNTFTGTNTFNNSVIITAGGSLDGTFSGNPNFSGSPTFSGNIVASQLQSTVATGTPPLIVASTTNIANLNASSLSGATFASPGPIGSGSPSTVAATTISATGQITSTLSTGTAPLVIASTTNVPHLNVRNINGVDYPASPSADTVPVITTANTTATYETIPNCPVSVAYATSTHTFSCGTIQSAQAAGCLTGAGAGSVCNTVVTWPTPFADNNYQAVCSGADTAAGEPLAQATSTYTAASVTAVTDAKSGAAAQFATIRCIAVHN